jgi:small-conductance mechanosensitive channel
MSDYVNRDTIRLIIATASFFTILFIIFFIYRYLFKIFMRKVSLTPGKLDDFMLNLFKIPALWFIYWVLLEVFIHFFLKSLSFFNILLHINTILLIFSITWISIQFIKAGTYYLQNKLDLNASDNLYARKSLTQIKVFKGIANTLIIIISIAICLLTFKQVRSIGISLLTSAGIFGIIIGFAAQKSIGMILAGIQIAITQPIRLDDVVIVEGEWGRIEEITLTYVVVKIWDERRLVMPVNSFLDKPFQNWTRTNSAITGTVFLYVDYSFPVDTIRKILPDMLIDNNDWDGRIINVQVTNTTERSKEIRILLSSTDASKNWDLRAAIREQLIDFINLNYPESFVRLRIEDNKV